MLDENTTLMCVGHNVTTNDNNARNIMFSRSVTGATTCRREKTGTWTTYSSPEIDFMGSKKYGRTPIENAIAVKDASFEMLVASTALGNAIASYQDYTQRAATMLKNTAYIVTTVAHDAAAANPNAVAANNAFSITQIAREAANESYIASNVLAIANDLLLLIDAASTATTDMVEQVTDAFDTEDFPSAVSDARNAETNCNLIKTATFILKLALTAQEKVKCVMQAITTAEKHMAKEAAANMLEKSSYLLKAADDTIHASAAFVIAADTEVANDGIASVECIRKFIENNYCKYNYICIFQKDTNAGAGIDSHTSMYICNAVYNLFSTNALKNVVLVITNRDYLTRLKMVLYQEVYEKISGPHNIIPIVYADFFAKTKSESRAILTRSLNDLRYDDTQKKYTPVLPDASKSKLAYKLRQAVPAYLRRVFYTS